MKATNTTAAVINYRGRAYGPNAEIEFADEDAKRGDIAAMLGDGRLSVSLGRKAAPAAGKPSEGLKVDELKAALEKKGVAIPADAKKEDLAKLLDEAP